MAKVKATEAAQSDAPEDEAAQASQDEKRPEGSGADQAQSEGQAAAQEAVEDAPVQEKGEEKLFTLEEMEAEFRTASWLQAALCRQQGWQPGKQITRAEYESALQSLAARRQGGGRR